MGRGWPDGGLGGPPIILLELLRGIVAARAQERIMADLAAVEFLEPTREDYVAAARLENLCRACGVQLGSVDALIAQLAIENDLTLLTTDPDFVNASQVVPLQVWGNDQAP